MAYHSQFNQLFKGKLACGLPLIPFRTKLSGPGSQAFQQGSLGDIIDEAFRCFRINVLFKNFQIKGPGDKVLIYLLVLISYIFKSVQNLKQFGQVQKKLSDINGIPTFDPKQKNNILAPLLENGNGNELQLYKQYLKQLKSQTINRFSQKFYTKDGFPIQDYKFWSGLAKKKFMGLNFMPLF